MLSKCEIYGVDLTIYENHLMISSEMEELSGKLTHCVSLSEGNMTGAGPKESSPVIMTGLQQDK